ncbi:TonB-dependent receptor [Alteromonas hispanica]|jgi:iron complex outermembrane receptor protein|uniref:TonB-dependent receptor n=1 Tax=Alteromonas hispanica TaxID=315421 RepID=A0A6L9MZ65_9ALTE|nr:TonB-dependent receptor [Alteromonas hispanica]NDW23141.1 TonB-dependent receptor [Alteromonas hispanica]
MSLTTHTKRHAPSAVTRHSLCAIAVAAGLCAAPAWAQQNNTNENAEKEKGKLERIEVTARRTVESLQETPVAITSVGAVELGEKGISVLTELQQFSPNTTLQTSRGTNNTLTAFIRGLGQQDPLWGYEPGVGIYVDDVYIARPQGAVLDLLNVQRIEVLRGPQGTLYGKNTIGGAVKYVTKEMSGDTEMNVEATVGSYNQRDIRLIGQVPLVEDTVYLGVGYANLNRDGFGEYLLSALPNQDKENYNKDLWAARLSLEVHASEDLFFRFGWDKTEDTSNARGGYRLLPSLLTDAPVPDSKFDSYTSLPTWNKVELEGYNWLARYNVNEHLELKYIGSYRESYSPTNIDFDNTPLPIFDVPAEYDDNNTTHELQANYMGADFDIVSGLYFYDGESCGNFDAILGVLGQSLGAPGLTREVTGCNNSESYAAYAQLNYNVSDKLSLSFGARYTDEEKTAFVNNGLVFDNVYPYSDWIDGYVRPEGQLVPQVLGTDTDGDGVLDAPAVQSWSRFTPRVGVEYQMDESMMFFASYSQGFKSGTFNPRAQINEPGVNPEVVDSFELGMKSDLSDTLRLNVTLFSYDHKDRQYIGVEGDLSDPTALDQRLRNAAETAAKGAELEMTWIASENLQFDAAYGYIDFEIKENNAIPPLIGLASTPENTFNFNASYFLETSFGDITFNANYYFRDDYLLFETSDLIQQDAYGMVNLSARWESVEGDWYGGIHVKNLTDEEYLTGGYDFVTRDDDGNFGPGLGGDTTLIGYYGDPRTVHLTLGYRF